MCNESLKINNNQAFANYILGDTLFELKDYEKSLKHYNHFCQFSTGGKFDAFQTLKSLTRFKHLKSLMRF